MSWKRKILLHLNAAILLLSLVPAAEAAPFSVHVGFGGAFLAGAWTPILVEIDGESAPSRGALEIALPQSAPLGVPSGFARYLLPYAIGSSGSVRRWITLPLHGGSEPLIARLRDESGRVLAEERIVLESAGSLGRLILVLDPAEESWAWIAADRFQGERVPTSSRVAVGYAADPRRLPDNVLALKSLAAVAVRSDFPVGALSRAQRRAIEEYVRLGGHLLFTGGAAPPDFPAEWRPWLPKAATGRVVGYPSPSGAVPGWELTADDAESLLDWNGRPIAVSASVGAGRITFIAVEPSSPLVRSAPLEAALRKLLFGEGQAHEPFRLVSDDVYWELLQAFRGRAGAPGNLPWLLAAYTLICTGLGAWASQRPAALAALGAWIAAGALFAGSYTRSLGLRDRLAYREVQVVEGTPHGYGQVRVYASLLSLAPVEAGERLTSTGPFFPSPRSRQSEPPPVELAPGSAAFPRIPSWQSLDFVYETVVDTGVTLAWASKDLLLLSNQSGQRLRHVHLVERGRFAPLGSVDAGGELEVEYPTDSWIASPLIPASLQSHLARVDRGSRPDEVELGLVSAALEHYLAARSAQEVSIIVALADPLPLAVPATADSVERRRVLLLPLPRPQPAGGDFDAG